MDDVLNWLAERADYIIGTAAIGLGAAALSRAVDMMDDEESRPDARVAAAGLTVAAVATGAAVVLTDWVSLQGVALGMAMYFCGRLYRSLKNRSSKDTGSEAVPEPEVMTCHANNGKVDVTVVKVNATSTVSEVHSDGSLGEAEKIGTESTIREGNGTKKK